MRAATVWRRSLAAGWFADFDVGGDVVIDAAADDEIAGGEVIGLAVIGGLFGSCSDCCQSDSENGGGLCQSVDGAAGFAALLHGRLSPLRDTRDIVRTSYLLARDEPSGAR